jgi:hypothetical protein
MRKLFSENKSLMERFFNFTRKMAIIIGIVLSISSAWASQIDFSGPSSEFLNSTLVMKTDRGTADLSIRLVEFLMGIQTENNGERKMTATGASQPPSKILLLMQTGPIGWNLRCVIKSLR